MERFIVGKQGKRKLKFRDFWKSVIENYLHVIWSYTQKVMRLGVALTFGEKMCLFVSFIFLDEKGEINANTENEKKLRSG